MVDDEKKTPWLQSEVVVADVLVAKVSALAPVVNGNAKPLPVASVPQEKIPAALAFTSQAAALRPETMRFVVEAVVAVIIVVEAYGNCDAATVEDAKKTPWVQIDVVVAAVPVAKLLVPQVNGAEPPPV